MSIVNLDSRSKQVNSPPADAIDVTKIMGDLHRYRWAILSASLITLIITFFYALTIQPQYQSTGLIRINAQSNNGSSLLSNIGFKSMSTGSPEDAELALIHTRYILEPVIKQNALNISATPQYFPLFGEWMAKHYQGKEVASPFLGLSRYAWGGENIKIKAFSVPPDLRGHAFRLVTQENNQYQLYDTAGKKILAGKVGEPATSYYYPGLSLTVDHLKANPGTEFTLSYRDPLSLVGGLSRSLSIVDLSTSADETGIVQLKLTGSNPETVQRSLNAIIDYVITRNMQQQSHEAEKMLAFLSKQLPRVKADLEQAEDALNTYHSHLSTLSMSLTGRMLLQQLVVTKQMLERLRIQKVDLLQIYTPRYPLVITTENQEAALEKRLVDIQSQIKKFPFANQEEINLIQEVRLKNTLYLALLKKMQELELTKAGVIGNILALGDATPAEQLSRHRLFILIAGFLMGLIFSSLIVIIRSALTKTIEDFNILEDTLQIPVQTVVPYSKKQKKLDKLPHSKPLILAHEDPNDIAVESLRNLLLSLHIMNPSIKQHVIALMGSLSGIGKTFVALNLAQIIADSGKRTLLIDADVRKGRLHKALMQSKVNGLSEYLEGTDSYEKFIHPIHDNLTFMSCGTYSQHPTELFQKTRFQDLIENAKKDFDKIIVDTPPVLPVSDSLLITPHCNVRFFVVSASNDHLSDVKQSVKKIQAHHMNLNGFIFNYQRPIARYGARYSHYHYAYGET